MAQLEEIKKIIRSLLVSAPVRVTVSSLNNDFKNLEGYNIPFRQLGYNSLLHLLHSIPDVLRVNGSSFQSEVTLIITEKVAHVSDMVMKQRKPSKGRLARVPTKSVIRESPNSFHRQTSGINGSNSFMSAGKPPNFAVNTTTSSDSSHLIKLSPFPRPLLQRFEKTRALTQCNPQNIQGVKLNFENTIKTDSDTSIENDSSTSYNGDESPSEYSEKNERVPNLSRHMPNDISEIKRVIGEKMSAGQSKFERLKLRTLKNKNESHHIGIETKYSTKTLQNDLCRDGGILSIEKSDNSKVPLQIQNKLKMLIKQHPSGIRCTDLPALYKRKYYKSLDYQTYGFDRLISLCINLENIFYCEPESDCDFKLYDVENPPEKNKPTDEETWNEIFKSNTAITPVDLSQIKAVKSKDWEVYDDLLPQETLKLGDVVENDPLNEYVIGETKQIVVSEIYNPSKFWIYKTGGKLNEMMNCMQKFYRENKKNYIIPEFLIEIGLYCVVYTLNEFQRAIVIDLLQEVGGHVKVYLLDYGTLTNLPREKVWFLSEEFSTLPAQAVETTMAGIQPKEGIWSKQSILRFKDMVASKHVFAKIIDKNSCILSTHIAVSSMPMQTLNDLLVQEGHAVYITDCELQDSISKMTVSEEKNPRKKWLERIRMRNQMKR